MKNPNATIDTTCADCNGTKSMCDFCHSINNDNPAKQFVQLVNEDEPGTFPTNDEMLTDHIMGDVDTFTENEGDIAA